MFGLITGAAVAGQDQIPVESPDTLPLPRRVVDGDFPSFSEAELERLRLKLKTERDRLNADWQALKKRNTAVPISVDAEQAQLEAQLRSLLKRLQQRPKADPERIPLAQQTKTETVAKEAAPQSSDKIPAPSANAKPVVEVVDPLAQAHALMRNRQYDEALNAFQQVDLKVRKSGDRAPVLYLKACCLLNLGKTKEAAELLQEVANMRSDEKLAEYAQLQLEVLRWRRDLDQRLEDIRQRQKAVEKR